MEVFRVIITILDVWYISLIWIFSRNVKNGKTAIGLYVMAALAMANAFLIWR